MFCKNCGSKVADGIKFCSECGTNLFENTEIVQSVGAEQEEVIDLSGAVEETAPQEKKYKPTLIAPIVLVPALFLMSALGYLFFMFVMQMSSNALIVGMFLVSLPFIIASLPIMLAVRKKAKTTKRKFGKMNSVLVFVLTWLSISMAMVSGFAGAFQKFGLLTTFTPILTVFILLVLILLCNTYSNQNGVEGYYCLCKAIFWGFLLSAPLGYALGMLLRMIEAGIVIFLVLIVLFFLFGGRVFFVRRID